MVKNDGRDILLDGTGLSSTGFGAGQFISQGSVSLRESKGQIGKDMADAMGFGTARKENVILDKGLSTYVLSVLGVNGFSEVTGGAFTMAGNWTAMSLFAAEFVSTDLQGISKMLQDVMGTSAHFSSVSGMGAYIMSAGSGFSDGSGMSQFAKMREGSLTAINNGFNIKDETSGVTTLKGAMAVMDIAETAIANLDQIRADIGSVQNQITATINNITVTQVNVKAAESQIRDVDFASESANYSKANILAQSGAYAMAQANASQQNVLRLLQ